MTVYLCAYIFRDSIFGSIMMREGERDREMDKGEREQERFSEEYTRGKEG